MWVRLQLDIKSLLKRRKKIQVSSQNHIYVKFKYDKLTLFCFLCGCLGHSDSFCPVRLRKWWMNWIGLGHFVTSADMKSCYSR
ncbi:hypothetical protein ES288_A07G077200v1 [Gossypium darwinii]|uniref:Zinc knuckle CX2CX4HX4C domain-containing protein n=1 Tax=Gossypium darwinii TaxID=34276 RepID=A0A5D2FWY9_GOSDA|nr:hypothetical protein ES288_A07G077200v1 [Gossypium darwinii]